MKLDNEKIAMIGTMAAILLSLYALAEAVK